MSQTPTRDHPAQKPKLKPKPAKHDEQGQRLALREALLMRQIAREQDKDVDGIFKLSKTPSIVGDVWKDLSPYAQDYIKHVAIEQDQRGDPLGEYPLGPDGQPDLNQRMKLWKVDK